MNEQDRSASFDDSVDGPTSSSPIDDRAHAEEDSGEGAARWRQAAALFRRWRDGEARAIDELVRLMTPVLWHVVRAYGLRSSVAEEVVQTTWLTLVRKHEQIAEPTAIAGWLTITARREAWRASRHDRRADPTEDGQLEARLPAQRPAEEEATQSVEAETLWRAVKSLDDRCQRLLRVVAFDDRPNYARIASDLGMPVGSIGPTRQRCLAKLRATLEGEGCKPKEAA